MEEHDYHILVRAVIDLNQSNRDGLLYTSKVRHFDLL
jgi:hypothetical protein